MKERPILFSGPMVRAILEGRKTQTRRVVKPQPFPSVHALKFELHPFAPSTFNGTPAQGLRIAPERNTWVGEDWCGNIIGVYGDCPYGQPDDRLWVRETWGRIHPGALSKLDPDPKSTLWRIAYRADGETVPSMKEHGEKWRPSIHMPRFASRITLEIESVRAERLQDITEEDSKLEGTPDDAMVHYYCDEGSDDDPIGNHRCNWRYGFSRLWDSINLKRGFGWESNPWVWVVTFRRVK